MHPAQRYTAVAIVLHWAIAAAIVANLLLGWWMQDAIEVAATQARAIAAFQLHKSIGLTVLALSVLRLAWRLLHPAPALPATVPGWERLAARLVHWAFYALMVAVPVSGWIYVSTQWRGQAPLNVPTLWFGLFEVPHLFGLHQLPGELRQAWAGRGFEAHWLLVWSMAALLGLHVLAALKHHFLDRDEVLENMLPAVQARGRVEPLPRDRRRSLALGGGAVAILVALGAIAFALLRVPLVPSQGASAAPPTATPGAALPAAPATQTAVTPNLLESGAPAWIADPARSEITFSGTHAGVPFHGRFTRWRAQIRFDPADPARSGVVAIVETGSATDGVPLHDETLPQAEWFDVARHPTATFRSSVIQANDAGVYQITGQLTIKDRTLVLAPLALSVAGDRLTISGRVTLDRREANLGMESDADAEYVSGEIVVEVRVVAVLES